MGLFGFGGTPDAGATSERKLEFPNGEALGMLFIRELGSPMNARWTQHGSAVGKVVIPAAREIMLQVRCEMVPDFTLFEKFGPETFHTVDLLETKVQDKHLSHLRHLSGLKSLNLSKTQITNSGLDHLEGLANLIVLTLYGTRITDEGLKRLQPLTKLETLWLNRTGVTDAGLEHLKEMKTLKEIYVADSGITDAGRNQFRQWVPGCYVRTGKGSVWSY